MRTDDEGRVRKRLFWGSLGVTLLLYLVPYGRFVAYPLLLLSTLAHELGHGVTAALVGGRFDEFVMHRDASGLARWTPTIDVTAGDRALVSAGGLVGPAVVAALLFLVARWEKAARPALGVIAAGLALAMLLVVRNAFGLVFVGLVGAGCALLAARATPRTARLALVFGAVQLALAVFSRSDYLFVEGGRVNGQFHPSDVKNMALVVGMPYWFWGLVCGLFSVAVLAAGGWTFLRGRTVAPQRRLS